MLSLAEKLRGFQYLGQSVPSHMHRGLLAYLDSGLVPGQFLRSVLEGDLFQAYVYADSDNLKNMAAYVAFLMQHADPASFGSKEKVNHWLDSKWRMRQNKPVVSAR